MWGVFIYNLHIDVTGNSEYDHQNLISVTFENNSGQILANSKTFQALSF